jgi:hypothetical protein
LKARGAEVEDVYMPYPARSVQEALDLEASPLPWFVFGGGAAGTAIAYLILWYTSAVDYPINVAGHPAHAAPAFIPITFETLVIFAGCTAFFAGLVLCGLPRLYDAVDEVEGFELVSVDRFVVRIAGSPRNLDRRETSAIVSDIGALKLRELGDHPVSEREAP